MEQTVQAFLKRIIKTSIATIMVVFLFGVGVIHAQQTLVEYPFTGESPQPTNVPVGIIASEFNISSGTITFGEVNADSWSSLPYAQGSSGWNSATVESAKNFFFTINPNGRLKLSEISFEWRVTGAGPSDLSIIIDGIIIETIPATPDETTFSSFDLSEVDEITNESIIRIAGWDNGTRETTGGGQFRVNDIKLTGNFDIDTTDFPYTQSFKDFVFPSSTVVTDYGVDSEWKLGSSGDELNYQGDWGSGSTVGLRGNSNVLGYQHTGTSGTFTIDLFTQNNTGETIEDLTISYEGRVERSSLERFPEWTVFVNGLEVSELSYSTEDGVDKMVSHTISGLSIAEGEFVQITWESDLGLGSGASRQIGLSYVSVSSGNQFVTSLTGTEGFRMLSAPVETTLSDFLEPIWTQGAIGSNAPNSSPNIFTWDNSSTGASNTNWNTVTSDLSSPTIAAGSGILVYVFDKDDPADSESNVWPKTLSVSGTENSLPLTLPVNSNPEGFTFLGNPTASALSWSEFQYQDLQDAVWIWDPNRGGDGEWVSEAGNVGELEGGVIRPFQAFFVRTSDVSSPNPSLTIPESARSTGGEFYGKEQGDEPLAVRLFLEGDKLSNSTWLYFTDAGLAGNDSGDAVQLQPLSAEHAILATKNSDGTLLDINHLPDAFEEFMLPVHLGATNSGSYTLTATDFNLPDRFELTFNDHTAGVSIPLNADFTYTVELAGAEKAMDVLSPLEMIAQGPVPAKADSETPYSITVRSADNGFIDEPGGNLPDQFALEQNYPNPFNPSTVINYDIPEQAHVRLAIYDLVGRQIELLVNQNQSAGSYTVTWDASRFSSGIYIYRMESAGQILTRQMTLIK